MAKAQYETKIYPGEKNQFAEFLRKEYDNIAQAHFKTTEMISEFIKHYLTIITIPFTVLVIVINLDAFKSPSNNKFQFQPLLLLPWILCLIIAIVGLMFFWYVLNLRLDALLYARTINGIRKYFYDRNDTLDKPNNYRTRVLPQSIFIPKYNEPSFIAPLLLFFTTINYIYIFISYQGFKYYFGVANLFTTEWSLLELGAIFVLTFALHFGLYTLLTSYREYSYLQSNIIGIDIDGVLNTQKEHFCKYLTLKTGKIISPKLITKIPVHDIPRIGISRQDELSVFNDPKYWINLPPDKNASAEIEHLRNSTRLKIHLFTSRSWPTDKAYDAKWRFLSSLYEKRVNNKIGYKTRFRLGWIEFLGLFTYGYRRLASFRKFNSPMEKITKAWLAENNIVFDRLIVETGSEEVSDPAAHLYNRFFASREKSIKYFVEDDLIKAEKLSYICDIVFLVNQPYNQKQIIPSNIIRVNDWREISGYMREFS